MKHPADPWNTLVEAARQVEGDLFQAMPFGFDAHVLAGLSEPRDECSADLPNFGWILRGALFCAGAILILALAANWDSFGDQSVKDLVLVNSNSLLQMAVNR